MSERAAQERYEKLRGSLGKAGTNALFPREFEYYLISLELINSRGFTEDFFTFPVTPNSISQQDTYLTDIQKTSAGVVVNKTDTFVPKDISIAGNFGRQFKTMVNRNLVSFTGILFTAVQGGVVESAKNIISNNGGAEITSAIYSREVKTGFGCLKVLESILRRAQLKDTFGKPYVLALYNPALGNDYLVEPVNFKQSQSQEENVIWNYNLELKAVAPIEQIADLNPLSLIKELSADSVLRRANRVVSKIGRVLEGGLFQ